MKFNGNNGRAPVVGDSHGIITNVRPVNDEFRVSRKKQGKHSKDEEGRSRGGFHIKYRVIKAHRTEYPDPILLTKGQQLLIGEKYAGPENWDNWYFCTSLDNKQGWVPKQLIDLKNETGLGLALDDYTAKELNVDLNETVLGLKQINGWIWCIRTLNSDEGWIPLENLEPE